LGGEFELALRVVRAYARIAEQGHDKELLAEIGEAWGNALLKQAQRDETERPKLEEAAQKRFRESAIELQELMEGKTPADRVPIAKRAAELWAKAGDKERAAKILKESGQTVDLPTENHGGSWFQKGQDALKEKDKEKALRALEKAVDQAGEDLPKARLFFAQLLLEKDEPALIEKAIGQLEANLTPEGQKDREVHELSVYLLGFTHFQRRDWRKAEYRLGQALEFYPESKQATKARFCLGRCYWSMAAVEADRVRIASQKLDKGGLPPAEMSRLEAQKAESEKQYHEILRKAAAPYKDAEADLLQREKTAPLGPEDAQMLHQASFSTADVFFYLGEYEQAAGRFSKLQERYAGKVEFLMASSQLWQCYYYQGHQERMNYVVAQLREGLAKMPDSEFTGTTNSRKREFWDEWLKVAEVAMPPTAKGKD
jgi:tetratricopeptide (TPR) repeat protein